MSICDSGIRSNIFGKTLSIEIADTHPLIILSNKLPWEAMYALILALRAMESRRRGRVVPGSLRAGCFSEGKI